MELELAITSYQRLSPAVTSTMRFAPGKVWVIGRSESCDWHLPDPGKVISSRHAEIRCDGDGHFHIRDTSTNGVFVNDGSESLGRDGESALNDGDRLRLGDYELSVGFITSGSNVLSAAEQNAVPSRPPAVSSALVAGMAPAGAAAETVKPSSPLEERDGGGSIGSSLASGLNERFLGDSHVEMPKAEIPDQWDWGAVTPPEANGQAQQKTATGQVQALLEGLGLPGVDPASLSTADCRALGDLTRSLLDRLLDLLHMRARQKQQLRVKQTLFQRSENNPLKFSATSSDALESLLFRRHPSFLGPEEAVSQAFSDVVSHEHALLRGVESVIQDILTPPAGSDSGGLFRLRRQLAAVSRQRQQHQQEYGDTDRLLRSDTFVDAYELAVSRSERE